MVFQAARAAGAAVAVVLAGGYAADVEDTVEVHVEHGHRGARSILARLRPALQHRQTGDSLHVDDLATPDHLARVGEPERSRLDVLVLVDLAASAGTESPDRR